MRYGWSLKAEEWKRLVSATKSCQWHSVPFAAREATMVPSKSGVYALCARPPVPIGGSKGTLDGMLYTALYIGQAESLRARFLQHRKNPKPELARAVHCFREGLQFWFADVKVSQLDAAESTLIDCLGPPANLVRGRIRGSLLEPQPA